MMQPLSSSLRGSQRERQRQLQRPRPQPNNNNNHHHQQQQQQQSRSKPRSQQQQQQQQQQTSKQQSQSQQQQHYHPHVVTKASPPPDDTLASTTTTTTHTMISDIAANLGNESLTDFTLVAKDGTRIPAARFVLGARSPVFRQVLFGSGKEARSDMMLCGYSGTVVRALVDFCSKDDLPTFRRHLEFQVEKDDDHHNNDEELPPPPEYQVRQIVHLYDCARYYQLQGMEVRVCELASEFLQQSSHKYLACALFDEASTHPAANRIKRIALLAIRSDPEISLLLQPPPPEEEEEEDEVDEYNSQQSEDPSEMTMFGPHGERQYNARPTTTTTPKSPPLPPPPPGVSFLTKLTLHEILKDSKMSCEEVILFRAILQWTETSPPEEMEFGGLGSDATHASFNSTLLQGGTSVRPPSKGPSKFQKAKGPPLPPSSKHPHHHHPLQPIDLDRCELAKEYVQNYIDLTKLGPSDLVGIVTESGLVPQDLIWNAMSDIALQMEKGGAPLSKVRYDGNGGNGTSSPVLPTTAAVPHEINVQGESSSTPGRRRRRDNMGRSEEEGFSSSNSIQTETSPNHTSLLRRGRSNTPRNDPTNGKQPPPPALNHYEYNEEEHATNNYPTTLAGQFTAGACGGMMDRNNHNHHSSSSLSNRPSTNPGLLGLVERFGTMCTTPDFRDVPSMSTLRQPHHAYPPPSSPLQEEEPQQSQRGYYSNSPPNAAPNHNPYESHYR